MNMIDYRPYLPGDEFSISNLIRKVYDEFVANEYSDEGNRFFYNWIEPSRIAERQNNARNIWVAVYELHIAGIIEIRDNNRISLLFVDKTFQGRGIAKRLFLESLQFCLAKSPDLQKFYVHASPFSVPVYKKLGFAAVDVMQELNGIKYLPMQMIIK